MCSVLTQLATLRNHKTFFCEKATTNIYCTFHILALDINFHVFSHLSRYNNDISWGLLSSSFNLRFRLNHLPSQVCLTTEPEVLISWQSFNIII